MAEKKKRVYIAAAYTKGDVEKNVAHAIEVGDIIAYHGMAPFIPHLNHFWHKQIPHDYDFWITQDNEWLPLCDALFRIRGESKGSDAEEALARDLGIPVFYSLTDLVWWSKRG